jgi:non-ribosomal peptide synthetase component F
MPVLGLAIPDGPEMAVAVLATLLAGAAVVPLVRRRPVLSFLSTPLSFSTEESQPTASSLFVSPGFD